MINKIKDSIKNCKKIYNNSTEILSSIEDRYDLHEYVESLHESIINSYSICNLIVLFYCYKELNKVREYIVNTDGFVYSKTTKLVNHCFKYFSMYHLFNTIKFNIHHKIYLWIMMDFIRTEEQAISMIDNYINTANSNPYKRSKIYQYRCADIIQYYDNLLRKKRIDVVNVKYIRRFAEILSLFNDEAVG